MKKDVLFMRRALQLAEKGSGFVAPNPLVGAIVVYQDEIIGEGYHQNYGGPHAEVHAIQSVKNKALLKDATIYVTLEPCAHVGKTPPCANLLIENQLKRVVIAMKDPFSLVDGKGITLLKNAGIEVEVGILEKEAQELNRRFLTFHTKKRPYITLKWAQTSDGFIAPKKKEDSSVFWISQPETQVITHQLRTTEQAILVGWKTINADNPRLTSRAFQGKNPVRIVIDPELKANPSSTVFTDGNRTIVLTKKVRETTEHCAFHQLESFDIETIISELYTLGIQSLIVEGGAFTLQEFISAKLWDEALVIIGQRNLSEGIKAPSLHITPSQTRIFGKDQLLYFKNTI